MFARHASQGWDAVGLEWQRGTLAHHQAQNGDGPSSQQCATQPHPSLLANESKLRALHHRPCTAHNLFNNGPPKRSHARRATRRSPYLRPAALANHPESEPGRGRAPIAHSSRLQQPTGWNRSVLGALCMTPHSDPHTTCPIPIPFLMPFLEPSADNERQSESKATTLGSRSTVSYDPLPRTALG